eukprot:697020-Pelagomonas_calceolata.AAC.1
MLEAHSQRCRHTNTNLANPKTPAWFMKSLRRVGPFQTFCPSRGNSKVYFPDTSAVLQLYG